MDKLRKKIEKLWRTHKKDADKILSDVQRLAKEGSRYIKDQSERGLIRLEIAALNLQKERLYYELGKSIARLPKNRWSVSKRSLNLASEIKSINAKIANKKRQL
jgi:predicted hydrocarbon binding protein